MQATSRIFVSAAEQASMFFEKVDNYVSKGSVMCAMLGTIRKVLKFISYFFKKNAAYAHEYATLKNVRSILFDIHVVLVWPRAPGQFKKAFKKSAKIIHKIPIIYKKWRNSGEIPKKDIFKVVLDVLYVFNHFAGGINKGILKPLKMLDKHVDLGKFSKSFGKGVRIFSLIRRGSKIFYLTGKIIQGKKLEKRIVKIIFQIPPLMFDILEFTSLRINPLFEVSFGLVKSIFELVTNWEKTSV